jgi:glycosyltransferase involved in cell wall biosynthesis
LPKPLISVIVPVYNAQKFLYASLESVLNQSYDNIELILVNDGSTDGSNQICDEFSFLDKRVHVIHQHNLGVCAARNTGLDYASGKYLFHLDNDDVLSENCLTQLYELIEISDAQIAIGNVLRCEGINQHILGNAEFNEANRIITSEMALLNMYNHADGLSLPFVLITGKLYEAQLFVNIRFPVGKAFDDEHVNYRLFLKANRIIFCPKPLYTHNIRKDSLSRVPYSMAYLDKIMMLEERLSVFKSLELKVLFSKTSYLYFHTLIFNLVHLRKLYPSEREHIGALRDKLVSSKDSLLASQDFSFYSYLVIYLYYYFPSAIQFKKSIF